MNGGRNVTMIENLPDLNDIETYPGSSAIRQTNHMQNGQDMGMYEEPRSLEPYQKFIRPQHHVPTEAGMESYAYDAQGQPPAAHMSVEGYAEPMTTVMPANSPTCIQVADHIQSCPICSKFYRNDNTAYVIAIVVLIIICILLMKKVLDL